VDRAIIKKINYFNAEAIHLGKKIISIPIRGKYEQLCNTAALEKSGELPV